MNRKHRYFLKRRIEKIVNRQPVDNLEAAMVDSFQLIDLPLNHTFIDGWYIREIFMPAGTLLTSKIHKTEHPYKVSKGKASVWINGQGKLIEAPYEGITKPGTRRVLYIISDCLWATAHENEDNGTDLAAIEERIIEGYRNPVLDWDETIVLDN